MNAIAFDTLKLARSLREKAKLTTEQAEGFADALTEALQSELATKGDVSAPGQQPKGDIATLGQQTKSDFSALRLDVQSRIHELELKIRDAELRLTSQIEGTKSQIASVRSQIEATKSELLKWTMGSVGLQTVAIVGAVIAIVRDAAPLS